MLFATALFLFARAPETNEKEFLFSSLWEFLYNYTASKSARHWLLVTHELTSGT